MTAFKRRPPAFAVRVPYCFVLDFVIAPVVRRLERSDRILKVLGAMTRRRARGSVARNPPSVSAVYRSFLKGASLIGSWAVNAAGYWAQRHRPNVLVVSFASMKRDLEATVRRVAEFLEIRVSDEVIREVCRKSSFDHMKSIDERFAPFQGAPWRGKTFMMRSGEQGASSALLTPQQQREMDAVFTAELQKLGSDLPYDEICGYTTTEQPTTR